MRAAYVFWYMILYPLAKLIVPCAVKGRENIPHGAAIVCANHTNILDPVLIAYAFGHKRQLFFMAKAELFKIPIVGGIFKTVGVFPIVRGETDINSIRTAMKHLKKGRQIMMFPEGTRVREDEAVAAKSGAVRIALKLKVPLLPVHLSKGKKAFQQSRLVIGEPYMLQQPEEKDYAPLIDELMDKIHALEFQN
ncbi:MAG: lysophospholipid acyltransferase family protein [Oscillospiraceae bacterium]|nr:lysophospholipid acyltransferase family protein [Oscillospiraceae bacterium]